MAGRPHQFEPVLLRARAGCARGAGSCRRRSPRPGPGRGCRGGCGWRRRGRCSPAPSPRSPARRPRPGRRPCARPRSSAPRVVVGVALAGGLRPGLAVGLGQVDRDRVVGRAREQLGPHRRVDHVIGRRDDVLQRPDRVEVVVQGVDAAAPRPSRPNLAVARGEPGPPARAASTLAAFGAWRSLVARRLWVAEVPGSNPGAPMIFSRLCLGPVGQRVSCPALLVLVLLLGLDLHALRLALDPLLLKALLALQRLRLRAVGADRRRCGCGGRGRSACGRIRRLGQGVRDEGHIGRVVLDVVARFAVDRGCGEGAAAGAASGGDLERLAGCWGEPVGDVERSVERRVAADREAGVAAAWSGARDLGRERPCGPLACSCR